MRKQGKDVGWSMIRIRASDYERITTRIRYGKPAYDIVTEALDALEKKR